MANLNFDNGLKTYDINGVENAIQFNATDVLFVRRVENLIGELDALQEKFIQSIKDGDGSPFDSLVSIDAEMKEKISSLFLNPVPEEVWGGQSVYTFSGGVPIWMNFMLMIMDECSDTYKKETKAISPAFERIRKKYGK